MPPKSEVESEIEFKDLLVLVPLLSAALAVAFDFGYFSTIGIGLFLIFSLSEHLQFALLAMPYAVMASLLAIWWFSPDLLDSKPVIGVARFFFRRWYSLLIALVAIVVSSVWFRYLALPMWLFSICFVVATFAPVRRSALFMPVFGICCLVVAAMFFGAFIGSQNLVDMKYTFVLKTGTEIGNAVLLRGGERGALIIIGKERTVQLIPWGEIARIIRRP